MYDGLGAAGPGSANLWSVVVICQSQSMPHLDGHGAHQSQSQASMGCAVVDFHSLAAPAPDLKGH